jgi:AP-2 complex subunit mu-1
MLSSKSKIKNFFGRVKYEPEQNAIVWRIKRFPGKAECMLTVDLELVRTVSPIPMFTGGTFEVFEGL